MGRSGGGVLELTPVPEQPCRAAIRVKPLGFPWPMGLVADQASSRVAPGCAERLSGWRRMGRSGGGVLELTPVPEQPCRAAIRVKPLVVVVLCNRRV